jgi:NAD kinase
MNTTVLYSLNVGPPLITDGDPDWQVMNEIALHRGSSPHLNTIDIFVDGQHLTEAVVCIFDPQLYSSSS